MTIVAVDSASCDGAASVCAVTSRTSASPVSSAPESTAKADRPRVWQAGAGRRAMVSVQCSAVTGVPSWNAAYSSRWNRAAVPPSAHSQEAAARAWKASLSRPVALIASTRQGEEVQIAKAMATRPELLRRAQFWLVPRHPQRFDAVFRTLTGAGLKVCRRSQIAEPADVPADTDVVLGDSMGEMSFYCALADMTAMGGSFQNHGSQNVIEPALAGSPIVVGPSIFNYQKVIRYGLSACAMVQVEPPEEALDRVEHWLDVPETRVSASEAALGFSRQYAGATQRMMTILEVLWRKAQKTASLTS